MQLMALQGVAPADIDGAIVATVVPEALFNLKTLVRHYFACEPLIVGDDSVRLGIKIDIEPRVHHNKEVTLKLQIEISQITGFQDGGGGQRQPIIGTRTIESTIRLKDGETNFLAGLIRTDETSGESGIPGLSDIPIFGRLFGKRKG